MRPFRTFLLLSFLVMVPQVSPARAQTAVTDSVSSSSKVQTELSRAREFIKKAEYDQAIETLEQLIKESKERLDHLDEAYLLLIKAYVVQANSLKETQGHSAAAAVMKSAREYVKECLSIPYLRHTRPPEDSPEYPVEMVNLFADVRSEIFGSFRVNRVIPAHAAVRFDGEPVPENTASGTYELHDIPAGTHRVFVHAPGYRDRYEDLTIAANTTPEKEYRLLKNRGVWWYGPRAVVLGAVGYGLTRIGGGGDKTLPSLPGPPDPPN